RTALSGGGTTVTAEGFLDQVSDSFAILRWPKFNFLPLPEDVAVPRAVIEQYQLRPGQKIAGRVRLPAQREKFLSLDTVTSVEGQSVEEWTQPTHFDKLTPQFPQGRIILENPKTNSISARAVDLLTPLGRGQRGLIDRKSTRLNSSHVSISYAVFCLKKKKQKKTRKKVQFTLYNNNQCRDSRTLDLRMRQYSS